MTNPAIELKGISKAFGPVQANKDISIRVMPGTIHGIIGENGAGKSTLMSILYGFYKADAGEIFISGNRTEIPDSQAAIAAGIGMVFQHFKLVENFTVLENIILGAEDGGDESADLCLATRAFVGERIGLGLPPDGVLLSTKNPGAGTALATLPATLGDMRGPSGEPTLKAFGQTQVFPPAIKPPATDGPIWLSILKAYPRPEASDS